MNRRNDPHDLPMDDGRAGYAEDRTAYHDDRGLYAGEPAVRRKGGAGMGIAALLLGILAFVLSWVPILGIILGVIAIIVGLVARGRAKRINGSGRGSGVAGAILGLLAVIISGLITFGLVSLFQNTDAGQCLQDAGTDQAKLEQCIQDYGDEARDRLDGATTNN